VPVAGVVEDFVAGEASLLDSTRQDEEQDEAHPPVPSERRGEAWVDGGKQQQRRCSRWLGKVEMKRGEKGAAARGWKERGTLGLAGSKDKGGGGECGGGEDHGILLTPCA
jgi:hypothetical protein